MIKAKLPLDEALRLSDLESYRIIDSEPEKEFDDLAELLQHVTGCGYVAISFLDQSRQWHKAKLGIDSNEHGRDISFCSHTILEKKVMVVRDATLDKRFSDNPLVTDNLKIRFYAGAPIVSSGGRNIGTVCAFDSALVQFTPAQEKAIEIISRQVTQLLELRLRHRKTVETAGRMLDLERKTIAYTLQNQESERRAMAVELHENFAQVVAACLMYVNLARENPAMSESMLQRTQTELHSLLQEMRRLSRAYNPVSLPVMSLEEVVRELVDQRREKSAIAFHLDWSGNLIDISGDLAINLFRIVDGYLSSIIAPGTQGDVWIQFTTDDHLLFEICDRLSGTHDKSISDAVQLNAVLSRIDLLQGAVEQGIDDEQRRYFRIQMPLES